METNNLRRILGFAFCLLALVGAIALGQGNLKVSGNINGTGWFNVNGDVNNNGASSAVTINPVVNLNGNGAGTQNIGVAGKPSITFKSLRSVNNKNKQVNVIVAADSALYNMTGGAWYLNASRLTVNDTIGNAGAINPNFASGNVLYAKAAGHQTVLGNVAYDSLTLSGAATFSLQNAVTADSVFHTGGAVAVTNDLTVNRYGSFASVADVTNTHSLNLGSNANTIATLVNNHGTIAGGTGAVTFSNAAINNGNINGGTGSVTFNGTLSHTAGTITVGAGAFRFNGAVTADNSAVIVASAANDSIHFANNVTLNTNSMLNMASGRARFDGAVALAASNFELGAGSWAYFNGPASQTVPVDTFGNMYVTNVASHALAGSVVVAGNLFLDSNIVTGANSVTLSSTDSLNVHGLAEVDGSVRRVNNFDPHKNYRFNRSDVYIASTTGGVTNATLTVSPATAPTGAPSTKYINRKYAFAGTFPGNFENLQLHYTPAEVVGANEARLGIRAYDGTWHKMFNTGYTRTSGGGLVTVANLAYARGTVTEFMMAQAGLLSVQTGNWATGTTWDEGYAPAAGDDATIQTGHTITVSAASNAATLDLQGTGVLTIGASGSLALSNYFTTASGSAVNVTGGNLSATDSISNTGSFTVAAGRTVSTSTFHNNSSSAVAFSGDLTADTLINSAGTMSLDGGATVIGKSIHNNGTITQAATGVLTMANAASGYGVTGVGTWTLSGATTVGTASFTNSMTTLNLTVNNTANLHVFGDLEVDGALTNNGIVTVGQ